MKNKHEIITDWLPRYTGTNVDEFGEYILLTNFSKYLEYFAQMHNVEIVGRDKAMPSATAGDITMINFGMGSPNAATVMDLLGAIRVKAALFLGKCGGLKRKNELGDFILPIAAIRGEGTSNDYFPPPQSGIFNVITGQELYILPTEEYGSMTTCLKSICGKSGPWQSIWRLLHFFL